MSSSLRVASLHQPSSFCLVLPSSLTLGFQGPWAWLPLAGKWEGTWRVLGGDGGRQMEGRCAHHTVYSSGLWPHLIARQAGKQFSEVPRGISLVLTQPVWRGRWGPKYLALNHDAQTHGLSWFSLCQAHSPFTCAVPSAQHLFSLVSLIDLEQLTLFSH